MRSSDEVRDGGGNEKQRPIRATGAVIASGVSYYDFLAGFEGVRAEWVKGDAIEMAGLDEKHDAPAQFLDNLFEACQDTLPRVREVVKLAGCMVVTGA